MKTLLLITVIIGAVGYVFVSTHTLETNVSVQGSYADNKSSTVKQKSNKPVGYNMHLSCGVDKAGTWACK